MNSSRSRKDNQSVQISTVNARRRRQNMILIDESSSTGKPIVCAVALYKMRHVQSSIVASIQRNVLLTKAAIVRQQNSESEEKNFDVHYENKQRRWLNLY
jgi:phosphoribosylpyrophosphate synthetase